MKPFLTIVIGDQSEFSNYLDDIGPILARRMNFQEDQIQYEAIPEYNDNGLTTGYRIEFYQTEGVQNTPVDIMLTEAFNLQD
jgi:hypothetical protein